MAVSEVVKRRQRALAKLHAEFVRDNIDAPFTPRPDSGDYNVHHVDVEADPAAEWAFTERANAIMAGELDDELPE